MPFHCTEAFNAESATCVMLLLSPLFPFVKFFDNILREWVVDSEIFCYEMCSLNRIRSALWLFCACGCEYECVPQSRRVWEYSAQIQIAPCARQTESIYSLLIVNKVQFTSRWVGQHQCLTRSSRREAKQNTSQPSLVTHPTPAKQSRGAEPRKCEEK